MTFLLLLLQFSDLRPLARWPLLSAAQPARSNHLELPLPAADHQDLPLVAVEPPLPAPRAARGAEQGGRSSGWPAAYSPEQGGQIAG